MEKKVPLALIKILLDSNFGFSAAAAGVFILFIMLPSLVLPLLILPLVMLLSLLVLAEESLGDFEVGLVLEECLAVLGEYPLSLGVPVVDSWCAFDVTEIGT